MGHNYSCGDNTAVGDITLYVEEKHCSRGITLYVEDKGGRHSVFGHIPVQKEKYYIIRIKKWLFGNRLLHLYTESYLPLAGK
jgi:hypothetical protein